MTYGEFRCRKGRKRLHHPWQDSKGNFDSEFESDMGECEKCGGRGCDSVEVKDLRNGLRTFWVIERYSGDTLYYWSARGAKFETFETDIQVAVKLADKASGEAILHRHLNGIGRVLEHKFFEVETCAAA